MLIILIWKFTRGIVVLNTPDANATTTAELAVALCVLLCRNLPKADGSYVLFLVERNNFLGIELPQVKLVGLLVLGQ